MKAIRRDPFTTATANRNYDYVAIDVSVNGSLRRLAIAILLGGLLLSHGCDSGASKPVAYLTLYAAAGLRSSVETAVRAYESESGRTIDVQYDGSGTLLARIQLLKKGDLFLAADQSTVDDARAKGLIDEALPLVTQRPVIAVKRGNPKRILRLEDLSRKDVKLSIANPDAAAIGKATRAALTTAGIWKQVSEGARVSKPTVADILNDLLLGTVDAAVVWESLLKSHPQIDAVHDDRLDPQSQVASVAVLRACAQPAEALRFARYLSAPERGLEHFRRDGHTVLPGDPWDTTPQLVLYAGAMLRPAIEPLVEAFERREGVHVDRVYNGCGILNAQIKTGAIPEAYFACDTAFLVDVADRFHAPRIISANDMVLLVKKGNPKALRTLADLARNGVELGIGHPDHSALGVLTRKTLEEAKLLEAVQLNVRVESPTGDLLVNQMRVGSLDAALVYRSNAQIALGQAANIELVELGSSPPRTRQPVAAAKNAKHALLAQRLVERLSSPDARKAFEQSGFRWERQP